MDWTKIQVLAESPAMYFQKEVQAAIKRQQVPAGEYTEYYLVNLLCTFVRPKPLRYEDRPDDALAFRLQRALEAESLEQRLRLRQLGDATLFTAGFFSDSLARRSVDLDYYVVMGEYAYGTLSRNDNDVLAGVFADLSRRFVVYMDVLADVSERMIPADLADIELLRLYEKWLRTGSTRDGKKLAERGIAPNRSIGKRFIQ